VITSVLPMPPARILIVDDDAVNRKVLAEILQKEGCEPQSAADGDEAVALALRAPPDLILLDIMMPAKDGYQVYAELQQDPRTMHVPVIFLSSLSDSADKIKGLELGAVDYVTKPFDTGEVLARVRTQLKIRRLTRDLMTANQDLRHKQERLDEDLQAAARIQRSLIPAGPPHIAGVRVAWRFTPCDRIGGDIFNLYPLDERHLALYVVDVSGHGVPAAMVTVSLSQSMSPQAGHLVKRGTPPGTSAAVRSPAEVLSMLDGEYPIERFDRYFTICYAVLDCFDGRLQYSVAGHPAPVLLRADGSLEVLRAGGTIIGIGAPIPFEEEELTLGAGDRLFLHTDGVVECTSASGELYGDERLHRALLASRGEPLEAACDRVVSSLKRFGEGRPFQDDVTLLAIEFEGIRAGLPARQGLGPKIRRARQAR
jgi:sigma-B regulation protein RsbU (phosphoserine phosphatase)